MLLGKMLSIKREKQCLLFDFDGVISDTESIYSDFWGKMGREYLGIDDLDIKVKGCTLDKILSENFADMPMEVSEICRRLDGLEETMTYEYIPGVVDFVMEARKRGLKLAIVTSSNMPKMRSVFSKRPEIKEMFDEVLTSEDFEKSKPDPDCYLKAMDRFGIDAEHSVVFEDSINGLKSARKSGARVIGLTTTNPAEVVARYASLVIPDFTYRESIFHFIEYYDPF